eukprot:GILK01003102.1.p1 GENE.GILK01003102.1~~GILK01003102.1.p1  ORF type:complete len:703 (-),score=136.42 GILK01003102.1:135-2201(-)
MESDRETKLQELQELAAQAKSQGEAVRTLKKGGAPKAEIDAAVAILTDIKTRLAALDKALTVVEAPKFDRKSVEDLCKRRLIFIPSFEIYGGVGGLYDYGPPGCGVKSNVEQIWRQHFVFEENMLEVQCTCLTPEVVLKTSGHVEKFTDLMVKDVKTGDCYRADKLLAEIIDKVLADNKTPFERKEELKIVQNQVDSFDAATLWNWLTELKAKAPDTGNALSEPYPFNLMFGTSIGPAGNLKGYLRPETAQGIFVNFRRLLDHNGGRMPFAAAQIGLGFRNEISPRAGLLRVREFTMAEIEHFLNPNDKRHPKFHEVKDMKLNLFPQDNQVTTGKIVNTVSLEEAVSSRMINNETLAYFMARTHLFLVKIGIRPDCLRFRQHLKTEMAHYASDCWDAEIETSYGWVECAGHADRACFDLSNHAAKSNVELIAHETLPEPRNIEVVKSTINNKVVGQTFKQKQKEVIEQLNLMNDEQKMAIQAQLDSAGEAVITTCNNESFTLQPTMVKFERISKRVTEIAYTPSVIEPSFGIGRIVYAVLEHAFYARPSEDGEEKRYVLKFPALVAPVKCAVLPLSANAALAPYVQEISSSLTRKGVSVKVDDSGQTIGKRYWRADEIGCPFGITVDFQTDSEAAGSKTVTLRERDSMVQVRIPIADVADVVRELVEARLEWSDVTSRYPLFEAQTLA